jgi:hypothetical protein
VPSAPTKPGTRRLSEVARHVVVPDGIVTTGYPAVRDKCKALGITHDEWQAGLGRLILGKRKDGKYAATIGGVVLSIPRQVGKTFLVGSIIVAMCLLFPGLTVLWTAHRTRTATETFGKMKGLTSRAKIKPFMLTPRSANGEQEIRFRNGSRILFGAREQGFGRGFDEVDVEVFDEAQILTEKALDDMVPATNQSRHPAGALLFYMGTPPKPEDPGDTFRGKRERALKGKGVDTVYVEMSADKGADPDDLKQLAKANPSFPDRTPLESILRMRENLGSDESYLREAFGIWDDDGRPWIIREQVWKRREDPDGVIVGTPALAIEMSEDASRVSIGLAGRRADGRYQVELIEYLNGTPGAAARINELQEAHDCDVVLDPKSPAKALLSDLEDEGVRVDLLKLDDVVAACGQFHKDTKDDVDRVRHLGDPIVAKSLSVTRWRNVGGARAVDRVRSEGDTGPILALMLAYWRAADERSFEIY